jgi:hypothetical protein
MDTEITCKKCRRSQDEGAAFYINRTAGKEYQKRVCSTCDNKTRRTRAVQSYNERSVSDPLYKQKGLEIQKKWRKDPAKIPNLICRDSRGSDKKLGRSNNLNPEWVRTEIANGCSYCGETELRMTLDRIDNSKGHTRDNVRPACIRCNYLRRDMPFEAWLMLVGAIRRAREAGTFGDWTGRTR